MAADRAGKTLGDIARARTGRARQQRHEFIAAPSRCEIATAERAPQQFSNEYEHGIALQMTVGVVDVLELIDINHEQGALALRCAGMRNRGSGGGHEGPAQGQSRQVIDWLIVQQWIVCRGTGVRPARRGNMGACGDTKANGATQTALRRRRMIRG